MCWVTPVAGKKGKASLQVPVWLQATSFRDSFLQAISVEDVKSRRQDQFELTASQDL